MLNRLRALISTPWLIYGPILVFMGLGLIALFCAGIGAGWDDWVETMGAFVMGISCIWSVVYGLSRAYCFNPLLSRPYYDWLSTSAWKAKNPLPKGPMYIIPWDLVMVGIATLALLAVPYVEGASREVFPFLASVPLLCFIGGYCVCYLIVFFVRMRPLAYLTIAVILLMVDVLPGNWKLLCLPAALVISQFGVAWIRRRMELTFRGQAEPPLTALELVTRERVDKGRTLTVVPALGWPHNSLAPLKDTPALPTWERLVLPLLCALVTHLLSEFMVEDTPAYYYHEGPMGLFVIITIAAGLVVCARTAAYYMRCRPPIDLLGRVLTLRWIIPRYDAMFLPLVIVTALAIAMYERVHWAQGPNVWLRWELVLYAFLSMWVTLGCPPRLRRWLLTTPGHLAPTRTRLIENRAAGNQEMAI